MRWIPAAVITTLVSLACATAPVARDFENLAEYPEHGDIYRHPELAAHADLEVRRKAQVMIPKGKSLKPYVAVDVIDRIDLLLRVREEAHNA